MSQPRTALLRHRPPLLPAFPPSCLPSSALRRAPAPSKRTRSRPQPPPLPLAAVEGLTGRGEVTGRGRASAVRELPGRAPGRLGSVHRSPHPLRCATVEEQTARIPVLAPPLSPTQGTGKNSSGFLARRQCRYHRCALAPGLNLELLPSGAPACGAPSPGTGLTTARNLTAERRGGGSCSGFWGLKRPPWLRPGPPVFEAPALGAPKGGRGQGFETEALTPKVRFLVLMPAGCRPLMLEQEYHRPFRAVCQAAIHRTPEYPARKTTWRRRQQPVTPANYQAHVWGHLGPSSPNQDPDDSIAKSFPP
ncbi:uncharacterized protein LOC118015192 isoform X2 [Mirounga leonina]|uniref:uncharacterized protein LOC118015192 isoform X2 n=1 Tax=Mirounga leonina TaxID=9715 RepID=UPI00156C3D6C|nr:uncharacterized protein LOC118015192 isoform X2 [Mirounga leonina]